ncbi:hypothetical protein [Mycoplasma sp. Ms02]|uniref:hypothetical protein n=1 Tax=Mycoplasma sp. Ms02 TaxID=353851 RepID=UPI001C8985F6|nr:hypothetical protein [Mycoplasma sp. Ms02]QZE12567.1 hypothetical protein K4L35_01090 [Mycoplasma sp. Ms02]
MEKVVNVEKVKLLAERMIELQKEVASLRKELKEEFSDTEIAINEPLSGGGFLSYNLVKPKARFDYRAYSSHLYGCMMRKEELTQEDMDKLIESYTFEKEETWKLSVKK